MFDRIQKIVDNFKNLDRNKILSEILSAPQLQAQIIDLNQAQLFDKGIEADGVSMGDYSKASVEIYGKRPGHITLKDTGEFYNSMKVSISADSFTVNGDTVKEGTDLQDRFPEALGLTTESIAEIIPEITESIIEKIKQKILAV